MTDPLRGQRLESFLVVTMQKEGMGIPGMLLNILRCPGQPPKQNYPAQMSVVPRRRKPAMVHTLKQRSSTYCTTILEGDEVAGLHVTQQVQGRDGTRTRLPLTQSPTAEPPYILPDPRGLGPTRPGVGAAESAHCTAPSLPSSGKTEVRAGLPP